MPTSFRKDQQPVPFRYRTPSPPRDALEPLSPTALDDAAVDVLSLQWADNSEVRNGLKRPCYAVYGEVNGCKKQRNVSAGAMDAFASIALATTSDASHDPRTLNSQLPIDKRDDRPSKRARSEKLPSPDWSKKSDGSDTRPATSYNQLTEDRRLEAELLLNFAQANFAQAKNQLISPSSVDFYNELHSPRAVPATNTVVPESETHGAVKDGQETVTEGSQDHHGTRREGKPQDLQEADPVMENKRYGDEAFHGPLMINAPQITIEGANGALGTGVITSADHVDVMSKTSEHDHVDLIPASSRLGQGAFTDQEEICKGRASSAVSDTMAVAAISANIVPEIEEEETQVKPQDPIHSPLSAEKSLDILEENSPVEVDPKSTEEIIDDPNFFEMHQPPQEVAANESYTVFNALDASDFAVAHSLGTPVRDASPSTPKSESHLGNDREANPPDNLTQPAMTTAICAACKFARNSKGMEIENDSTSWISCDVCKSWFHFACAGFKSEREVRGVDKFRCSKCKPIHGPTTYVRKSSRAHSAIDYAGLHQGVIKTSDERPEHHYIKPIKEGTITFSPENFARMRPELVTAEFFERGTGMKEPVVIPAYFNPSSSGLATSSTERRDPDDGLSLAVSSEDDSTPEDWLARHPEREVVPDYGQDALDMVVPRELTVRQVAELYGPEEKVEVIDVKSQNGENKKWNMRRWAEYYENPNNKVVRNVISLEVSQSKLGRLIKRPQIVRDLDLQDSVWPEDLLAKGEYPRVQFYCLMSVADCFTDFHIDFGGSSVFYHILKGKKTFLFIPPKEKHLKKYEEWCMSPAQNWTFLGDQTKECYRVDLSEGDTMLIPSGWIHAVWTPEDSLVIGGNFLTRMNYGMQLRVAQVEKATGVARKFRYPHFQKLHWYIALRYLENDPLPANVRNLLHAGGSFHREVPAYHDFDAWGENSRAGPENYQARYYSQPELEGLPDLTRYLLRTALIDIGSITDGISADTRNAVKKSIPRGHGEPLDVIKTFAVWCAWKRGNEPIPHWAYPDAVPENISPDKLSAAAMKKLDREAALSAPRRHSARMQAQQELSGKAPSGSQIPSTLSKASMPGQLDQPHSYASGQGQTDSTLSGLLEKPKIAFGMGSSSHRKTACESCRKRRRACKHKDQIAASLATSASTVPGVHSIGPEMDVSTLALTSTPDINAIHCELGMDGLDEVLSAHSDGATVVEPENSTRTLSSSNLPHNPHENVGARSSQPSQEMVPEVPEIHLRMSGDAIKSLEPVSGNAVQARPRHKACNECRKSKVRIVLHRVPALRLM